MAGVGTGVTPAARRCLGPHHQARIATLRYGGADEGVCDAETSTALRRPFESCQCPAQYWDDDLICSVHTHSGRYSHQTTCLVSNQQRFHSPSFGNTSASLAKPGFTGALTDVRPRRGRLLHHTVRHRPCAHRQALLCTTCCVLPLRRTQCSINVPHVVQAPLLPKALETK